jgi:hypothetical protein
MPSNRSNNEIGKAFAIGTKIEYMNKLYEVTESDSCCDCSLATICSSSNIYTGDRNDNALSREPEVMIIIDGYVGMINPFPISKIKKI